jgi:S-adenosylmethionine-diacylgycerolhomoserine-N-methlytransferase
MTADAAAHMDRIYRRQTSIYDATRKYYLLGRDRLLTDLTPPAGGSALEIACGTGRNLIHAARRYPDASHYGLDVSKAMLDAARRSIRRNGLDGRIALAKADATDFDPAALFGRETFDRVAISYALSMIPGWREAITAALRCLAPGGRLHIVDFGQLDRWPVFCKAGLFIWLKQFDVSPRSDLENELKRRALAAGAGLAFEPLYGGYAYYAALTAAPMGLHRQADVGVREA